MRINLKLVNDFNIGSLKWLIESEDYTMPTHFRVSRDGFLFLSTNVGNHDLEDVLFRLDTSQMNYGHLGRAAAENTDYVDRVFKAIEENWPGPTSSYIDTF